MAKSVWLAVPIAVVVVHRFAWGAGATTATAALLTIAAATFGALFALGLILRRLGLRSRVLGVGLAAVFWLTAPNLTLPGWIGDARIEPEPVALGPSTQRRDLVVVLVDDYPSSKALLDEHGYDNAEFQLELSERGYHIPVEPWSNSSNPLLAAAAALTGRYPGTPGNERERRQLSALLEGDNPVADTLRADGYRTTHLGAPSAVSAWFSGPDRVATATFDGLANALDAATGNETPDFVFAHINGCDTDVVTAVHDDVVARAVCVNRLIVRALDPASTDPSGDTVVVIAGTRGSRIDGDLGDNPPAWPRSAIERGLGVFAAIRLAPECPVPADDATVAVIVHHGVACALGVDPDPPAEQAIVVKGDPVYPDGALEINLDVLRSDLSGQNLTTSR